MCGLSGDRKLPSVLFKLAFAGGSLGALGGVDVLPEPVVDLVHLDVHQTGLFHELLHFRAEQRAERCHKLGGCVLRVFFAAICLAIDVKRVEVDELLPLRSRVFRTMCACCASCTLYSGILTARKR